MIKLDSTNGPTAIRSNCRSKFTSKLALTLFIWTHQSVRTKQEYTCCSSQPKTIKTFKTSPLLRVNRSKTNDISSNFARLDLYGSKKWRENTKAKNTGSPAATDGLDHGLPNRIYQSVFFFLPVYVNANVRRQ